jgi:hypothetical protein
MKKCANVGVLHTQFQIVKTLLTMLVFRMHAGVSHVFPPVWIATEKRLNTEDSLIVH